METPRKNHRWFSGFTLGGLALVLGLIAFGDQDRRGLLLFGVPEAFALNEGADGILSGGAGARHYPVVWGYRPHAHRAARRIPAGSGPIDAVETSSGPAGGFVPRAPAEAPAPGLAPDQTLPPPGDNPKALALVPIGPGIPGSGPIGGVVVPPTSGPDDPGDPDGPPVVPAVPEPASWLLMILGIGWLGMSLRAAAGRRAIA